MKKGGFLKFGLGVALGAGASMLLNPESGKANREKVKKQIDKVVKSLKEVDTEEVKKEIIAKVEGTKKDLTYLLKFPGNNSNHTFMNSILFSFK